jgi:O-antigen biosynthesis protein
MIDQPPVIAPSNADVYYHGGYWNDLPAVNGEINRRISGRPDRNYIEHFKERTGGRRFARALFLNCGNGWVERDFFGAGLIDSAVGIDFSEELLAQAIGLAGGLPVRYVRADINEAAFPDERFDLVVNFAAAHHIAYVDRVFRRLCGRLTEDGIFVNYDYVGPHRNQYPYEQWSAVWETNNALPPEGRAKLAYPHLKTMLATDPSEAIHSELTLETFRRYFTVSEFRPVGGAVAYPLLTFHDALAKLDDEKRASIISTVLETDARYLADHPNSTLFAFWYGSPRHDVLKDAQLLARWEREEAVRERAAVAANGLYYSRSLLQDLIYPNE